MADRSISQSELARRIGISQASVYRLAAGDAHGSKHIHRIARELGTTPAYLMGEIDDPDAGAAPPPPPPPAEVQLVTMQVALPPEEALTGMFRGLLLSLEVDDADEIAPELAKLLPIGLQTLQGPLRYAASDAPDVAVAESRPQRRAVRGRRQG